MGENWHSHHGKHKFEGGRSVVVPENAKHPVLNGVDSFYTPTDIYGVVNLDEEKSTLLLRGAVTVALDPAATLLEGDKNNPMMPLAWLKDYQLPGGDSWRVFWHHLWCCGRPSHRKPSTDADQRCSASDGANSTRTC